MISKQLAIFLGVGLAIVVVAVVSIVYGNKGNHLDLKWDIKKIRTGAIDENNSAAVLDFRVENVSDVPLVVRAVRVAAEKPSGEKVDGYIISKSDFKQLLEYNKFLGKQFNEGLSIRDKVPPHQTVDRMVAARFEIPVDQLDKAKQIHITIEDMDGLEFDSAKAPH